MGGEDARRHRWQVLSIALLLALGVGMFSAMSSMSVWRVDSADSSFPPRCACTTCASRWWRGGSTCAEALAVGPGRQRRPADVAAAAERLVVATQVDASTHGPTILVPGRIVGTPPGALVDTLAVRAGRLPAARADARPSRWSTTSRVTTTAASGRSPQRRA